MVLTDDEVEIESLNVEHSDIILSSSAETCSVCKTGKVVCVGRETEIVIYTRSGTKRGIHVEKRCNNRLLSCRAGHYYGYHKMGATKHLEADILKNEFLVTSNQTAFEVKYLWDVTLQILFSNASFESLGNVYNNLHFTNLSHDIMQKRDTVCAKRITEAFFTYAYIDLGQRYDIELVIPSTLDEAILTKKSEFHDKFRKLWTNQHLCNAPGCGKVLVMDGGLKPHRKLCGSKLSGVREFDKTGLKVVTGCTSIPAPESKFCYEHKESLQMNRSEN